MRYRRSRYRRSRPRRVFSRRRRGSAGRVRRIGFRM